MPDKDKLIEKDLPVVDLILSLHPDLEMVLFVGTQARSAGLKYPVKSPADLGVLFPAGQKQLTFRGHSVTQEQAAAYMPKEFFPIENELELLRRVLICLQRETLSQKRQMPPPNDADVTFFDPAFNAGIPGPAVR
jgi:hypothetical protein